MGLSNWGEVDKKKKGVFSDSGLEGDGHVTVLWPPLQVIMRTEGGKRCGKLFKFSTDMEV